MPEQKLQHARELIRQLEARIQTYVATKPYEVKSELQGLIQKKRVYCVSKADPLPADFPLLIGGIIQNLRSALDHITYRLFLKTNPSDDARYIYFPVHDEKTVYDKKKNIKLRDTSINYRHVRFCQTLQGRE